MKQVSASRRVIVVALTTHVVILAVTWGFGQTVSPATRTDPKINEPFKKPDVKGFIKKFETEDREVFAKRDEIVSALGLKPGMSVADVGAGTGLFTRLFADKVGTTGRVYAVDIAPRFLAHIAAEAKKRAQSPIVTVLGSQASTNLPRESVDLVFLCDVYHHLENPEKTLASIRQALKPEGRLVVIDFDRVEGRSATSCSSTCVPARTFSGRRSNPPASGSSRCESHPPSRKTSSCVSRSRQHHPGDPPTSRGEVLVIDVEPLVSLGIRGGHGGCCRIVRLLRAQLVPDFDEGLCLGVAPG